MSHSASRAMRIFALLLGACALFAISRGALGPWVPIALASAGLVAAAAPMLPSRRLAAIVGASSVLGAFGVVAFGLGTAEAAGYWVTLASQPSAAFGRGNQGRLIAPNMPSADEPFPGVFLGDGGGGTYQIAVPAPSGTGITIAVAVPCTVAVSPPSCVLGDF